MLSDFHDRFLFVIICGSYELCLLWCLNVVVVVVVVVCFSHIQIHCKGSKVMGSSSEFSYFCLYQYVGVGGCVCVGFLWSLRNFTSLSVWIGELL